MISGAGLVDVELANPLDTFAGASAEESARELGTWATRLQRVGLRRRRSAISSEGWFTGCALS